MHIGSATSFFPFREPRIRGLFRIRRQQPGLSCLCLLYTSADELRGAVDGWDFKNYVLGTMFYRYISENLCNYINAGEIEAGNADFDYAKLSDEEAEEAREGLVQEKGFFILPSELFCNVRARACLLYTSGERKPNRWNSTFKTSV